MDKVVAQVSNLLETCATNFVLLNSLPPSAIPKGWNHSAQGCEERATLGLLVRSFNPAGALQGLYQLLSMNTRWANLWSRGTPRQSAATLSGLMGLVFVVTQGSSCLATLG